MANINQIISNEFYFNLDKSISLRSIKNALSQYRDNFSSAMELSDDFILFLDTNIYLDYYGMSQKQKKFLLEFLNKNKDKIVIPNEVEVEFLRNRMGVIEKDLFIPMNAISTDFSKAKKNIINQLIKFENEKKKILSEDYSFIWDKFIEFKSNIENTLDQYNIEDDLEEEIKVAFSNMKNINISDDLLSMIGDFNVLPSLSTEEKNFLKTKFDDYSNRRRDFKETLKSRFFFPGCGDSKDNPYGDFIIYHEMLKFMKTKEKNIIFLTNDVTKADWIKKDRSPILKYIENTFELTKKTLYIFHAEPLLEISFENIHENKSGDNLIEDFENLLGLISEHSSDILYSYLEKNRENKNLAATTVMNKLCSEYGIISNDELFTYFKANRLYNNSSLKIESNSRDKVNLLLDDLINLEVVIYNKWAEISGL